MPEKKFVITVNGHVDAIIIIIYLLQIVIQNVTSHISQVQLNKYNTFYVKVIVIEFHINLYKKMISF